MSHDHGHTHDHGADDPHSHHHGHGHGHGGPVALPPALDLAVAAEDLPANQLGRRRFLQRVGLLGAAAAGASVLPGVAGSAAAAPGPGAGPGAGQGHATVDPQDLLWLTGDHHIHTQYSPDAQYRVSQQVDHATRYGLDWMVITDHGSVGHAKIGVEATHPDIVQSRIDNARTLVFQGLEWNIPAAEHGTVIVAPGTNDVATLKEFETTYDGVVNGTTGSSAANEAQARAGVAFLGAQVRSGRVADALMLANHPARKGIDSPHEIRGWRDTDPTIAVGMEGAPGHQAAAIPGPGHATNGRGYYDNAPSAASFPGYPAESYVTYGGFDWMTSTVGGLWDSLLAEGKGWWITANSDSHQVYGDTFAPGTADLTTTGSRGAPVDTGAPIYSYGDFWPGYYSGTVVGATDFSYGAVMAGIRAGRVYVVHGGLVGAVSARLVRPGAAPATLGGTLTAPRVNQVELQVDVALADRPNYHGDVPVLRKLDVVVGTVTGPAADRDAFTAPQTRVVKSYAVPASVPGGVFSVRLPVGGDGKDPFYVRLRGSDGKRVGPGLYPGQDPAGPVVDALGNADPWQDLWFYTNPIFAVPTR
ncbi:PHP domain-containing protein [Rhodococcus aerolatus]